MHFYSYVRHFDPFSGQNDPFMTFRDVLIWTTNTSHAYTSYGRLQCPLRGDLARVYCACRARETAVVCFTTTPSLPIIHFVHLRAYLHNCCIDIGLRISCTKSSRFASI